MRLLLVEDSRRLAAMIVRQLTGDGFTVDHRATLDGAREALEAGRFDLIILDLGLPDGDGLAFLADRRRAGLHTPVLVLTARAHLDDRVAGLDAGADDYLAKPFESAELAARCRALLRRPGAALGSVLEVGDLTIDTINRSAMLDGRDLDLGPKEFALLELLARRQDRVVHRDQLEQSLYSMDAEVSPNALDALVSRLRRRLAAAGSRANLRTSHGVGYALAKPRDIAVDA